MNDDPAPRPNRLSGCLVLLTVMCGPWLVLGLAGWAVWRIVIR